ncbi:MAG: MFS transporter [Alphaproteobacteria bacterium]|nr:MFS transporter [Alphaproteobacteria bacterium]
MRGSIYYGWVVLAASALSELLVQGATLYSAGLFVLPLQTEFHISRAAATSAGPILFLGVVFMAPLTGRLLDHWPVRRLMVVCALILAASLCAIAWTHSLAVMAAILLVPMAAVFMGLGQLNTTTLASRWFYRHRGLALGIAAVATSGGGLVAPLLSHAIQQYGWRQALFYEGLITATVIIAVTLLAIRDRPADLGLTDHPENQGRPSAVLGDAPSLNWTMFLFSPAFWIPALTLAIISGTSQVLVVSLVPYGAQLGMAPTTAALSVSLFAITAAITKIGAGLLADRINQRYLLTAAALAMTLSWLSLSLLASQPALMVSACLGGAALGCALPTAAGLIAGIFGSAHFARVFSWCFTLTALMAIAAVRFAGFMYDKFGNYHAAFESFASVMAVLLVTTLLFKPQRVA